GARRLRLRTLIRLRWLTIAGQAVVLTVTFAVLKTTIPFLPCLTIVGAAVFLNLWLVVRSVERRSPRAWEAAVQIGFDILQLGALLFLTGGVLNPFCLLLIAPVAIAAGNLPTGQALALGVLAVAICLILALVSVPLPWAAGEDPGAPPLYRWARGLALIIGIVSIGGYAFWAAREAARMALALHVAETVLAREQRLSALGGLAAVAAHELGTPLATISVVAKELAREAPEGPLRDDAWLLVSQAQRCRDILRRLGEEPEKTDELHERMTLLQFVREVLEPYPASGPVRAEAVVTGPPNLVAPDVWRRPEVLHAIASILDNAFDFARAEILLTARFDTASIVVEVRDDGPGFAPEILARLGEPYVTSRPAAEGSRTGHVGMGLGFFIAKTLLERTGAEVSFRNTHRAGAVVKARWPRAAMEAVEPSVEGLDIPRRSANMIRKGVQLS
ncbi:MAG: ActS/PrrB/RegB family redox-sensitive histidine kinase, partial [Caulobacteraceae bacterium]